MNSILDNKKALVLDLDGTVYRGQKAIPEAVKFIRRWRDQLDFHYITNNTSRDPGIYHQKLAGMGVDVAADHLHTPALGVVHELQKQGLRRVFLSGSVEFRRYFARLGSGIDLVDGSGGCDAVVLAYDTDLDYGRICVIHQLLQDPSVKYFATHPDTLCPAEEDFVPDLGSFLALFSTSSGRLPDRIFGKPDPVIIAPVLEKYAPEKILVVGDRLYTDRELAVRASCGFVLVLSGESTCDDLNDLDGPPPVAVVENLGYLDEKGF